MGSKESLTLYRCDDKYYCSKCPQQELDDEIDLMQHLHYHRVEEEDIEIHDVEESAVKSYKRYRFRKKIREVKEKFKREGSVWRSARRYKLDEQYDVVVYPSKKVKLTPREKEKDRESSEETSLANIL